MAKLDLKTGQKGNVSSISLVADMLRKRGNDTKEVEVEQQTVENKEIEKEKQPQKKPPLIEGTDLENMLFNVKQHRDQNILRRPIMVDENVYDVFAMLKAKKRVPAAGLVSVICRDWIENNRLELERILGQKINVQ